MAKITIVLFLILISLFPILSAEEIPRYIFYNSPRAEANLDYLESCFPKGEVMPVIPGARCCEGLNGLGIYDESHEECSPTSGSAVCSDCGNGKCEYGENKCSCSEDCTPSMINSAATAGVSECQDHKDNDGDGYCDYAAKDGYCIDGSHAGDLECDSKEDSETSCVSSEEICDGKDNDCDGKVDEDIFDIRDCGLGIGECKKATQSRKCILGVWDVWDECSATFPLREICDGKDNDCDGTIDEACSAGETCEIYSLTDAEILQGTNKNMKACDNLMFSIYGEKTITLTKISGSTIEISLGNSVLKMGDVKKFDLNSDSRYDLQLSLNSITGNSAEIYIKKISEQITSEQENKQRQEEEKAKQEQQNFEKGGILSTTELNWELILGILIGVIILLGVAVVVMIIKKKRENEKLFIKTGNLHSSAERAS